MNRLLTVKVLCKCYFVHTTHVTSSVCHMVDREFQYCILLQCGRIGLHLCLLYCQVLTVETGPYTQMLNDDDHVSLPSDIHSTLGSRTMGR